LTGEITPDLSIYASMSLREQGDQRPHAHRQPHREHGRDPVVDFREHRLTQIAEGLRSTRVYHTGDRAINPQNSLILPDYTLLDAGGLQPNWAAEDDGTAQRTERHERTLLRVHGRQLHRVRRSRSGEIVSDGEPVLSGQAGCPAGPYRLVAGSDEVHGQAT
jgi:hypothetical protein